MKKSNDTEVIMDEIKVLKEKIASLESKLNIRDPAKIINVKPLNKLSKKELLKIVQTYDQAYHEYGAEGFADVVNAIRKSGLDHDYEQFYFIVMNNNNVMLDILKIDSYKKNDVTFETDVVFKKILNIPGAQKIIVAHNHPVGDLKPSDDDDKMTTLIYIAASLLGLFFADSIILCENRLFSYNIHRPDFFPKIRKKVNKLLKLEVFDY